MVVYVVSDALGETGELVARAASSQFAKDIDIRRFSYVSEKEHIAEIVEEAQGYHCIIAYTLVVKELEQYLLTLAAEKNIPTVDILGSMIDTIAKTTGTLPKREPGLIRKLDEQYFRKVDAVDFAVKYDDGKNPQGLIYADLVILGVSRTSKTPLCMYLAHKRLRAANMPLVPEVAVPEEIYQLPRSKIFGLTIEPGKLYQIRSQRLKSLGLKESAGYASMERICYELEYAMKIMNDLGCHIIDVTDRAVEETANMILDIYYRK